MAESDLTQALQEQQQLLQRLYRELDVEREASASAASEAMSMILRLQGEKASLKMEAIQYKRMAEEKMDHAEESLAIFEDLIHKMEMEIASLEFQVQAYRYRLLSMGNCNEISDYEHKFPENLLTQRNDKVFHVKDFNQKKCTVERRRSVRPLADYIPSLIEENDVLEVIDSTKKSENFGDGSLNSYREQIKRLDERVKGMSDVKVSAGRKKSTLPLSMLSDMSNGRLIDQTRELTLTTDSVHSEHLAEKTTVDNTDCSSGELCEYKIIEAVKSQKERGQQKKEQGIVTEEISEDWTARPWDDKELHEPKDIISNVSNPQKLINNGDLRAEYDQLIWRIERLENTKNNAKQEVSEGGEELNLLKDIKEQLKLVQLEMKTWKVKKSLVPVEQSLDLLSEAMLQFWF